MFRIVLIEPEIPQNTGNIGRLCVAAGLELVLVGKLGFSLDDRYLKRSGMDYWSSIRLTRFLTLQDYLNTCPKFAAISTKGTKLYTDICHTFKDESSFDIVFGCESAGLPKVFYGDFQDRLYRIPMGSDIRSLNLSSAVAVVSYFILEKNNFMGLS